MRRKLIQLEKEISRCKKSVENLLYTTSIGTDDLYLNKIGFLLAETDYLQSQLILLRERQQKKEEEKMDKMDEKELQRYLKKKQKWEEQIEKESRPIELSKTQILIEILAIVSAICAAIISIYVAITLSCS